VSALPSLFHGLERGIPRLHDMGAQIRLAACPLSGAKRTSVIGWPMSANDPKQTSGRRSSRFRNLFRGNRNDELISLALDGSSNIRPQLLSKTRDDLHSKSFALREVKVSG
jgi:hypothetical protein